MREENTDRVSQPAVGGDVKDVLVRVRCRGGAFSDEVVLVNVTLGSSVSFEAADGHGAGVSRSQKGLRWALVVGSLPSGGGPALRESTKNPKHAEISAGACGKIERPDST